MINRSKIYTEIDEISEELLANGINEDSLELLASKIQSISEDNLEDYFIQRSMSESVLNLVDKDAFSDFSNGYVAQMRKWQRENAIKISLESINIDDALSRAELSKEEADILKNTCIKAGIGSLVSLSIGKFISGAAGLVVGLVAEMAVLLILKNSYDNKKQMALDRYRRSSQEEIDMKVRVRKDELKKELRELIDEWLSMAQEESSRIEKSFSK